MAKISIKTFLLVAVLVAFLSTIVECNKEKPATKKEDLSATEAEDTSYNYVLVHFMDKKLNEFQAILPDIKDSIASRLNGFCRDEANRCGTERVHFNASHIGIYGSTEKEQFHVDGRFTIVKLYAKLSHSDSVETDRAAKFAEDKVYSPPQDMLPRDLMEGNILKHLFNQIG